jgi:rhodanese-related sulfurtransferase
VANELVEAGHKYVDVRTPEEFENGHPEGAINVPYMLKHGGGMTKNQDFIREMKDQFDPDAELVVGCLSGKRSMLAAAELVREEFTNVTDVGGGYQAWEMSGLPVEKSARVA